MSRKKNIDRYRSAYPDTPGSWGDDRAVRWLDGTTTQRPHTRQPASLLPGQQFALLLFGQPDVGNVCTML